MRRTNAQSGLVNGSNFFLVDDFIRRCAGHGRVHHCCALRCVLSCAHSGNTFDEIKVKGGIILVVVNYNCDDIDRTTCPQPDYTFFRLDPPGSFSPGFNFRYSTTKVAHDGKETRTL